MTRIFPPAASSVVSISEKAVSSQRASGLGERLLMSSTAITGRAGPAAGFRGAGPRCWTTWTAVAISSSATIPSPAQPSIRRSRGAGFAGTAGNGAGASGVSRRGGKGCGVGVGSVTATTATGAKAAAIGSAGVGISEGEDEVAGAGSDGGSTTMGNSAVAKRSTRRSSPAKE